MFSLKRRYNFNSLSFIKLEADAETRNLRFMLTRMHSSRMRTARLLPVSPSMHCSGRGYLVPRGCTCPGGCTWSQGIPGPGGVPGPGGCTWFWGGYLVWGVCLLGRCTWSWGVPGSRGGIPARGVPGPGGYLPRYPPCEQNVWQTGVKILPCPKLRLRAVITFHENQWNLH